ncbi:hypothetical protein [Nocardiopsis sp. CNT312]|uniref:hypothetical protein n=1 Tax=Nocardiopsis sp. CNT312 TaxID=1137268 RepID=UPI0012DD1175|nr:hypothetical protein [Nocardiopsis sp. CNT312]
MADVKEPPQKKQGLHGWKAAGAVFGCGTLAAFGTFGVLLGVANMVLSSLSSGIDGSSNHPQAVLTGDPIPDLDPGEMNLCVQDVQHAYPPVDSDYYSGNYEDPALDGNWEDRTVRDRCVWEIMPTGSAPGQFEPWEFSYSYESVIDSPGELDPDHLARERFDELVEELSSSRGEVIDSGEGSLSERSHFFYEKSPSGGYAYFLVGKTRSTVYVMSFFSPASNGEITKERFSGEARHVASYFETSLQVLVPE